ncbi:MAG: hypothetical protein AAB426_06890 [Myxococcota bacterium]
MSLTSPLTALSLIVLTGACAASAPRSGVAGAVDKGAAAEAFAMHFVAIDHGVRLVGGDARVSFALDLRGAEVGKVGAESPAFVVDNRLMALNVVEPSAFLGGETGLDARAVLERHMRWEAGYVEELMRKHAGTSFKIGVSVEPLSLPGGRPALFWSHNHPTPTARAAAGSEPIVETLFATTIVGEHVVALSTPRTAAQHPYVAKSRLEDALRGLRVADEPYDLAREQERARSEPATRTPPPVKVAVEACDKRVATACGDLGLRHFFGVWGAREDLAKAMDFLGQGCELGDASSCYGLSSHYINGLGVASDRTRGRMLLEKACAMKLEAACKTLEPLTRERGAPTGP